MVRPSTAAILIETTTTPITGFPYVYLEKKKTDKMSHQEITLINNSQNLKQTNKLNNIRFYGSVSTLSA